MSSLHHIALSFEWMGKKSETEGREKMSSK